MPPGVRQLTVLGKFKPFGLIAEATDGKSPDENSADSYQYLLFDPELTGERDDAGGNESNFSRQREHELFIRDNRIIWTSGSRVLKRFTLSSAIIKACWSHLGRGTEAFLCVLQIGCLTIYNTSGEVVSVPLPRTVKSIWPLPFGLLLQQAAEVNPSSHVPFSSVSPIIGSREMLRQRKEVGNTSPQNFHSPVVHDLISKRDMPYMSSHLILRDPLEEPGPIYVEERGKINIMKEYDERTIWTSDRLPLMTSYNKGKMQHSVWTTEFIESNLEASASCSSGAVPDAVFPKRVSFRRIWQAKGAKKAASKVFLATDDAVPVICFLILEQKKLLLVGLQTVEINNEILFDVKPDLSWSVSAIAAAPVVVTRSQVKIGLLPHLDIIVLSPENELFLYSGKQCLCRYVLPSWLGESIGSGDQESAKTDSGFRNLKITGLSDAVLGCINLSVNHSQIFRCALTGKPSSLLANDCIAAIAEGLRSDLYNLFLSLLWGDGHSDQQDSSIHFEWEALCNIFLGICQKPTAVHLKQPTTLSEPSWEFLLSSKFHKTYSRFHSGITSINPLDLEGIVPFDSKIGSEEIPGSSFELMVQSLDCLHAVYESLKMDNLRKQDLHHLAVLLCNIAKFLDEKCYLDHYIRDFPRLSKSMGTCTTLSSSRKPPNLFRWLENCLRRGCLSTTLDDLPELIRRDGCSIVSWARKVVSFYSVLFGDKPEGRTLSSGVPCNIASGSYSSNEELTILAMAGERFGLHQLDLLPSGVSLPLRHALDSCRESPPADWPAIAYVLLGREDMALSVFRNLSSSKEFEMQSNTSLISMSIPYMLHLHPVIVPSSLSESIGLENTKIEDTNSVDGSVIDGMEHIFNSFTQDLHHLAVLLCNIAKFLDEKCYLDHYIRDFPRLSKSMGTCTTLSSSRKPPNLFRWLENCLRRGCLSTTLDDLPELIRRDGCSIVSWARKVVSFYSVLFGDKPEGRTLSSGVPCNIASGSYSSNEELTILAMAGERFGLHQLDLLPSGVSLPLRHALDSCRESPPADWPAIAYVLLGREDMALSVFRNLSSSKEFEMQSNTSLISMSIPYMLHLHPVIVPSSLSESIGLENTKIEDTNSVDGSVIDGMEHIFNSFTQLRYGRDLRLNEVRRLLCSARPVVIQTSANPTISDQEQQQDQLWRIAQRTAVLPLGRGAFTLSTIHTLLTEAFTVPKLVLAGRLPAQQNAIVNLDPNVRNIQELKTWPEFHNAVAAGLRLAPLQGKVSRTWIKYNKPGEPNAVHAGLLFGLGLQGYLHVLNRSDIYQYFTQDHESTTVGLMLGLAASYRRTMQPDIAKALFFHVPARYQASYAEFEIPTLLQSAALVSVGMLFEGSAHLQTMQLLLGEIGRRSAGDNVLEREGYAVSAGFSLGLVALGRGGDALGSMDSFVNRLLQYLGAKEERSILAPSNEDHRSAAQITDGSTSNVDITAPGAIIALTLMYLKTESEVIFSKLSIPQTHYDLECVRPDFIMLRVIARNLIMWSRISPTCDWIQSQVPEVVKNSISHLRDDMDDMYEVDVEALVQAYVNIVAGACISLGLRFAGTRDGNARDLLNNYALCLLNEIKPLSATPGNAFPRGISKYVDRGTLEMCLYLIIISLSVIMAGSGDLQVFRLLRFLRSRNSADGHANYGTQMAVSLATGFLFLGGGMRTFSTNNGSLAMLLITLYPRLPSGPNDNRCHLQAFRHLYVLATEARWLQTIDVDSGLPVYAPLEVTVKETKLYSETRFCEVTPCILPERAILKRICVCGPRYWPQQIELVPEEKNWWSFGDKSDPFNSGVIYVKRKVGACSYVDDPVGCQSLLSRAMHKVFGLRTLGESNMIANSHRELDSDSVDHLVSTFSSDPSLIAFAQLCCDKSWDNKSDSDFKEFCLQVLFDCISKDRPALLQVYLSLYTTIGSMADLLVKSDGSVCDSLSISSLKVALAYNEAVSSGRLASSGGFVQSSFLASLRKRCEEILNSSTELKINLKNYLTSEAWPDDTNSKLQKDIIILSWYLKWFSVPSPSIIKAAVEKIKSKSKTSTSAIPLLRLLLPSTHISAISEINTVFFSSNETTAL